MPSINDSGSEGTLRAAIAVALGHRIPVEGGWATAVIDLSNPHPPPKRRKPRPGLPVLRAVAQNHGRTLAAWCCYCRKDHFHGRHGAIEDCGPECGCLLHADYNGHYACTCPAGAGNGMRAAHCRGNTPFIERGYYLMEIGS
jgi:hypothetical protein